MSMHSIQTHIMKMLTNNKSLRYAQMKPLGVEGNQFSYHLNALQNEKFVFKKDGEYSLTTKGVRYSTQVNFEQFFIRIQPKIVTLVVCKNKDGEYLLYKRGKLPFLGKVGFPYGKIHLGENVKEAAERELKEKTGISATLSQKGIMYLTVVDEIGEIITHMLCHIFEGKKPKGDLLKNPPFGEIFWMSEKGLLNEEIMPGVMEVLEIAKSKSKCLIFRECEFQEI
jgi:8-oxo-dGTP diphosphatase